MGLRLGLEGFQVVVGELLDLRGEGVELLFGELEDLAGGLGAFGEEGVADGGAIEGEDAVELAKSLAPMLTLPVVLVWERER